MRRDDGVAVVAYFGINRPTATGSPGRFGLGQAGFLQRWECRHGNVVVKVARQKIAGQMKPVCLPCLDTLGALAMLAMGAGGADDEHGAALAAARLVGRHRGVGGVGVGGYDGVVWCC
jgi:hypothetical protein